MSFTALNLSVEDVAFDAEEHTREIQIEEAFKLFQRALKLQKELSFDLANTTYKQLFAIEVVNDITKPYNNPNIRMLRYLAHRNRGLLHLEELKSAISTLSAQNAPHLLLNTIDDLITSLQYTDEDLTVELLLLSIFELIGSYRLARFVIEYELSNKQNEEITLHHRNRVNSVEYSSFINQRQILLNKIGEATQEQAVSRSIELPRQDLSFLKPVLEYLSLKHDRFLEDELMKVKLTDVTWKKVAVLLNDLVSKSRSKNTKNEDLYFNLESPITALKFEVSIENSVETKSESPAEPVIVDIAAPDSLDEQKKRKQEDAPQRSSKRVKEQTDIDQTDDSFILDLNLFLSKTGLKLEFDLNSVYNKTEELYLSDFFESLNHWRQTYTEDMHVSEKYKATGDSSDSVLSEIFISNNLTNDSNANSLIKDIDDTTAVDFVKKFSGSHYIKFRNQFIIALLSTNDNHCPITDSLFGGDLYKNLETLVLSSEDILFSQSNSTDFESYSVSIFEILTNSWIHNMKQLKLRGLSTKAISELNSLIDILTPLVLKWRKYLTKNITNMDEVLKFRFDWCTLLYHQHSQSISSERVKELFNQLYEKLDTSHSALNISFVNYQSIPSLSLSTIKVQNETFNVITLFEETLNSENSENMINLVERLLYKDNTSNDYNQEELAMIKFVEDSPIALKLKLWKVLLAHYLKSSNISGFQKSLNAVLEILINQLAPEQYNHLSDHHRKQILFTTLGNFSVYIEDYISLVKDNDWKVDETDAFQLLKKILALFKILYVVFIFDSTPGLTKTPLNSKFKDIIVGTMCIILPLYGFLAKEEKYTRLFNVFHSAIGESCNASGGKFLDLSQRLLKDIDMKAYEPEVLQHLACKYHVCISSDTFVPFMHFNPLQSKLPIFERDFAIQISPYILNSILSKNYFFQSSFKQDLKAGLDRLYKTFGDPNINDSIFQRNEAMLDLYVDRPFDLRIFKDALSGELNDEYRKVPKPERDVYDGGLYYLEGVMNLNLYKSRKKSGQSKSTDLEFIIKMFRADLISGTNRVESWFCLGQSYALQAEDDLTWTSEKLNTIDKKLLTATLQKKAILCYLMSINLIIKDASKVDNIIKATVFSTFGRELYHSLMRPMDGFAYLTSTEKKVLDPENGIIKLSYEITAGKKQTIMNIILRILKLARNFDQNDWMNYFYLAKITHKLNKSSKLVLENSLQGCNKNSQAIESHYQLASLVYKYYRSGAIDLDVGLQILKKAPCYQDLTPGSYADDLLINFIISALKKLILLDKRKWQHQPRTRIARIYYDLGDFKKSFEEMDSIIVLKSTGKNFVNIWKPEFEAPGKHFVYTTIYIDFYIKLISKLADLQSMILFNRRLRRFGASMINLPSAWDISCAAICNLIKDILHVEKNFTDIEVPKLVYSEFMSRSEKINAAFKDRELKPEEIPFLVLLFEISDIRRMNNGFGSTSQTDDVFNAIYLKIYLELVNSLEKNDQETKPVTEASVANSNPTTPVKVKVARRDILAVASSLCKIVEQSIKSHRITDDVGFEVPKDVIDKRMNSEKSAEDQETEPTAEDIHNKIDDNDNNGDEGDSKTGTASSASHDSLLKTPERKFQSKSPADVGSSDVEEFHTPTEITVINMD